MALHSFRRRANGIEPATDKHLGVPLSTEMPRAIPVRRLGTPLMNREFQVAAIDHKPVDGILRDDSADFALELSQCRHRNRKRLLYPISQKLRPRANRTMRVKHFLFPANRRSIFGYLCHCNLSAMLTHPSVSVRYIARDSNSLHANASEEGFRPRGIAVDPPKCETSPGVSHSK
jgi:hypothetical protein